MSERTLRWPVSVELDGSKWSRHVKGVAPQMDSVKSGRPASRLARTGHGTTPLAALTAASAATSRDRSAHGG
ncbi:hypothetical protein ABQF35_18960 [Mycobacterium syngnathidarum]